MGAPSYAYDGMSVGNKTRLRAEAHGAYRTDRAGNATTVREAHGTLCATAGTVGGCDREGDGGAGVLRATWAGLLGLALLRKLHARRAPASYGLVCAMPLRNPRGSVGGVATPSRCKFIVSVGPFPPNTASSKKGIKETKLGEGRDRRGRKGDEMNA